jgi:hypothetical protein
MTDMFQSYAPPENTEGDRYKPIEHVGSTLVVKVLEFKPRVITENSPEGGPAVIVDVLDLESSSTFRNVLWMSGAMVDGLKPYAGSPLPVVIRIEAKNSKNGRKYPIPATAEDEIPRASQWIKANGDPFAQQFANSPSSSATPPF